MKNIISVFILICSFATASAQFKYPATTKKTYNATNLKKSKSGSYSASANKISKKKPVPYSPLNYNSAMPNEANQKIIQSLPKGIVSLSFAANGAWVMVTANNDVYNYKAPKQCMDKVNAFKRIGHKIEQVSFHPKKSNSFVIITDKTTYSRNIPNECYKKIQDFQKNGKKVKSVSFGYKTNETWVIINTDGSFYANNVNQFLYESLKNNYKYNNTSTKLTGVSFAPDGSWVVLTDKVFNSHLVNPKVREVYKELRKIGDQGYVNNLVAFTPNGRSWCIIANLPSNISASKKTGLERKLKTSHSKEIAKNSYTSGDGVKDIRKWVLKVTLDYFYCDKSDDSDKKDDYVFNQWVQYTDKNNKFIEKLDNKMYVNNSRSIDTRKQTLDHRHIVGDNIIIKSDRKHQFWVKEGSRKKIGNYIRFEITEQLLNDKDSRFIIYSSLAERTDTAGGIVTIGSFPGAGIDMSGSGEEIVYIKKVIKDLSDIKSVKAGEWRFYSDNLKLRKYNSKSDDLYGYIYFRDKDRNRKAKAMMRFKLEL